MRVNNFNESREGGCLAPLPEFIVGGEIRLSVGSGLYTERCCPPVLQFLVTNRKCIHALMTTVSFQAPHEISYNSMSFIAVYAQVKCGQTLENGSILSMN